MANTNWIHRWGLLAIPMLCLGGGCAVEKTAHRSAVTPTSKSAVSGQSRLDSQIGSAYESAHHWRTDRGEEIKLEQLKGHPAIIAMFYTSCHLICPITLENLQWIDSSLEPRIRTQVPIVLVSIDPTHDTVEVLRSFRSANHLATRDWILLRGDADGIKDLARSLQIPLPRDPGSLGHSTHIVLLDQAGRIRGRQTALHQDLKPFLKLIRECAEASH